MPQTKHQNLLNHIGIGIVFYITMLTVVGTFSILFRNLLLAVNNHPILDAILAELFSILIMVLFTVLFKFQLRKMDFSNVDSVKKTVWILALVWIVGNLIQAFLLPELVIQLIHIAAKNKHTSIIDDFYSTLIYLTGNFASILIIATLFINFKKIPSDHSKVS